MDKEKQNLWRNQRRKKLNDEFIVINPCIYIPDVITPEVEKSMMQWDLWQVRNADIVVCDFSHPQSIGTTWELALAVENNIPVIGVYTNDEEIMVHPWWKIAASHVCDNIEELVDYVRIYYGE